MVEFLTIQKNVAAYVDEDGYRNDQHRPNRSFGRFVGPILLFRVDIDREAPLTWHDVCKALEHTHHGCGWPLAAAEKKNKPFSIKQSIASDKSLPKQLMGKKVWNALWGKASDAMFHSALRHVCEDAQDETASLTDVAVSLQSFRLGAVAFRQRIRDPRQPYPCDDYVDTVAFMLLTVEGGRQRPNSIAHFLSDGTLVRSQVNAFLSGAVEDNGMYIAGYADELKTQKSDYMTFVRCD